jgi:hypothetical protein
MVKQEQRISHINAILNARSNAESLQAIGSVVSQVGRGVYKRIDENRELLELLKSRCPEFLEQHFWVEGWIRSQDEFLTAIADASGAHKPPRVSLSEILCVRHTMSPRSMYAEQDTEGCSRTGAANHTQRTH